MSRFSVLTSLILLTSAPVFAQEIGQQGGDIFVPAAAPPPVTLPSGDTPSSRHADDEAALKFKSETVLVQVPTVVTDKSGNHLHNLSKNDFKILENGKQQKIAAFEEISTSTTPLPATRNAPGVFSNVTIDQQPRAITMIALDTINTPFLDQAYGRKELIKYLADHLETGQIMGLVVIGTKGVKVLCDLNSDPASLIAALKEASGEVSSMEAFSSEGRVLGTNVSNPSELKGGTQIGETTTERMRQFIMNADALEGSYQQSRAIEDTMKAFLAIAWSLSGIPGRKSLIWATGGFPFVMDSPASVPGDQQSLLYERAMEALKDAQVSIYPVDVRGLVSAGGDVNYAGDTSTNNVQGRSWLQNSTLDTLKTFAEMTGGRAYYNSNDLASGFKRAADDASSYYLLGYYMNTHDAKPGWRKLQVEVQRKDIEIRARTGFFVTNATVDPDLTHKADVGFALASPFDSTGIPVSVKWQGISVDGAKKKVAFAIHLPAVGVIDEADKNRFDVDFVAQASAKGNPVSSAGQTTKGTVPAANLAKIKADGIFYQNALELPPGSYDVRFVVRDNLSGRIGSVTAPLTVN